MKNVLQLLLIKFVQYSLLCLKRNQSVVEFKLGILKQGLLQVNIPYLNCFYFQFHEEIRSANIWDC
ncbi:unnamed protein product [Paramecium octaurelia]|uniref:Uncharacterized protein n=1 Tax=Paramecium octaurelia TaxID=43137 RepID=A0A8S1VP31_PAROT|nr:unnamed protein product [Paramecium octaurelia]